MNKSKGRQLAIPKIRFYKVFLGLSFLAFLTVLQSCKKPEMSGLVKFTFSSTFDSNKLVPSDSLFYKIPSGQTISVSDIQYFISHIVLIDDHGKRVELSRSNIHYIDMKEEASLSWTIDDPIPNGLYTAVEFTYGLDKEDNTGNRFINPPQSLMFWPEALGGGYHYMKINGKWSNEGSDTLHPYGLHTGIGQTQADGALTEFHHNYVSFHFDSLSFFITTEGVTSLNINMEVKNWFDNPNLWDFNTYGGSIMQNQKAQQTLRENAWNSFTINE